MVVGSVVFEATVADSCSATMFPRSTCDPFMFSSSPCGKLSHRHLRRTLGVPRHPLLGHRSSAREPHFLKFKPRRSSSPRTALPVAFLALESTDFRCNPYAGTASKIETVFLS